MNFIDFKFEIPIFLNQTAILFIINVIAFCIGVYTFRKNIKQQKIQNTFLVIEFLRKHISESQIQTFITLFHANNPLAVPYEKFRFLDGREDHIDTMFSEGGCGNGDIHNMIEIFNLLSIRLLKNELVEEYIWYEYGQIMMTCFKWTSYLEKDGPSIKYANEVKIKANLHPLNFRGRLKLYLSLKDYTDPTRQFYFNFNCYIKQKLHILNRLPVKYYTYVE